MTNNERKIAEKALQALSNGEWDRAIDQCHKVLQLEENTMRGISDDCKSAVLSVKAQALAHLNKHSEARRCLNDMYQLDKKNTPEVITVLNPELGAVFVADEDESPPIRVFMSESVKEKGCAATLDAVALAMWSYLGQTDASFPNEHWQQYISKQDLSALEQDREQFALVWSFFQKFAANSEEKETSIRQGGFGFQGADEYFVQGQAFSEEGQHSKAADAFKKALDSEVPLGLSHDVALQYWIVALYNAERYKEVEEATKHAKSSDPEIRLYHGMAVLAGRGDFHEADLDFQAAKSLKPHDADIAHGIGLAWMKYGDKHKAETALRRAVEIRPEFPAALFNLALTCQQVGNLEEAKAIMRNFLNAEPSGPFAEQARNFLEEI